VTEFYWVQSDAKIWFHLLNSLIAREIFGTRIFVTKLLVSYLLKMPKYADL